MPVGRSDAAIVPGESRLVCMADGTYLPDIRSNAPCRMAAKTVSGGTAVAVLLATIALPLIGAMAAGRDVESLLQFPPPLEIPHDYPRFSWVAAAAVVALLTAIAVAWLTAVQSQPGWRRASASPARCAENLPAAETAPRATTRFPPWGWWALAWTATWWLLAWSRFGWFAWAQRHTFFPLWLGFIVTVNALVEQRSGTCLMRRTPAKWLTLFAASAGFWWIFEWLNRFVRNWHYLAVEEFGPAAYAANATLCFSTVLPAVASVREWLGTFPLFEARTACGPAWNWLARPFTGWLLMACALAALLQTGARPREFYPALWVAPLALVWGLAITLRRPGTPHQISSGNWRIAAAWMLASLFCSFWWEMWNWHSLAKWIYTVPYVERWLVFEMPLLGYAGYLPFGLECLLVVEHLLRDDEITVRA
jgi:hypothetical protein